MARRDTFLSDSLFDENKDYGDSVSVGCLDMDFMTAEDASLSSYLSGDVFELDVDNSTRREYTDSERLSPSKDNAASETIVVVNKPSTDAKSVTVDSISREAIAVMETTQKKRQLLNGPEFSVEQTHMSKSKRDTFLGDSEFDELENVNPGDSASWGSPDLDIMAADDTSLSSYLSGDIFEVDNPIKREYTGRLSPLEDGAPGETFVVISKPGVGVKSERVKNSNSREAVAARENRQKKKQYLNGLEVSVKSLTEENDKLKQLQKRNVTQISRYREEVRYLKSVIANDSALSFLLKNVLNTAGVKLSASLSTEGDDSQQNTTGPSQSRKRKVADCSSSDDISYSNATSHQPASSKHTHFMSVGTVTRTRSQKEVQRVTESQSENEHSKYLNELKVSSSFNDQKTRYIDASGTSLIKNAAECVKTMDSVPYENDVITVEDSQDENEPDTDATGGICLHVLGGSVSIEFCSFCNRSAARSCSRDHTYFKT